MSLSPASPSRKDGSCGRWDTGPGSRSHCPCQSSPGCKSWCGGFDAVTGQSVMTDVLPTVLTLHANSLNTDVLVDLVIRPGEHR
jgi:hypothetical protein